jgi:AhpD family alkylhydroperoxidase
MALSRRERAVAGADRRQGRSALGICIVGPEDGHMTEYREVIAELAAPTRDLKHAIPDVWAGFSALHQAAMADGALPARVKELIALAIAVVKGCDGCIAYHARAAARGGATADEVAEALGVALLMDGGSASVNGPRAWKAFDEMNVRISPTMRAAG